MFQKISSAAVFVYHLLVYITKLFEKRMFNVGGFGLSNDYICSFITDIQQIIRLLKFFHNAPFNNYPYRIFNVFHFYVVIKQILP